MTAVHILGEGPYRDIIEYGLEGFGYSPVRDIESADVVVAVGDVDVPPLKEDQRTVRILEPDQVPDRGLLGVPRTHWMVPSKIDAGRLLSLAAEVGEAVDVSVLTWSSSAPIVRQSAPLPTRVRVYRGSGSLQIPITLGVMVEGFTDAELIVAPKNLHQLLHAQHAGVPALVEEATPLAEYIEPGVNGQVHEREDFNKVLAHWLENPRLIRGMTVPQPGMYVARRQAFVRALEKAVTGRRLSVVFGHGNKPGITPWQKKQPIGARGMRYQALVAFGASVMHVPEPSHIPRVRHDFIMLGGRVQPERVAAIRAATKAPIVMAMSDAILEMPARLDWFRAVGEHATLIFTGEPPELLPKVKAQVFQQHQAPLTLWGPRRSTVRAPYHYAKPEPKLGVIFLVNQWYKRRTELVQRFTAEGPVLHCIGAHKPPKSIKHKHSPPIRGKEYGETMQRAVAVLSTSICNDRNITSCRLFEACSVGAYVLAEAFPGCRAIYPDDCVDWWDTPEEASALAKQALRDPESGRIAEMRWNAQERTWRHFSAHDRMEFILETIRRELAVW